MSNVGKKNRYVCQRCGHNVVTVDKDEGVTPFMLSHREVGSLCPGIMQSNFYKTEATAVATFEWFKPTVKQVRALYKHKGDGAVESMVEHVQKGGLIVRAIPAVKT